MIKQFVIIFGIMVYKFQNNGKIINIKIQKEIKKKKLKLWYKLMMKRKFQIRNITTTQILQIIMG